MAEKSKRYLCPYCGRITEDQICECKNTLYMRAGFYVSGPYDSYKTRLAQEEKCEERLAALQEERIANTAATAAAFIDRESTKVQETDTCYNADVIRNDRDSMIAYLYTLVCAEGNVYSLGKIYTEVCRLLDNTLMIQDYNAHVLKTLLKGRRKSERIPVIPDNSGDRIKTLTEAQLDADGIKRPVEPVKPVLTAEKVKVPARPEEPVYEKPGLLNRKRVEAKNEEKKRAFELATESYQQAVQMAEQYKIEKKRYDTEMKAYKVEFAAYQKALEEYLDKYAVVEETVRDQVAREKKDQEKVKMQEKRAAEKEITQICEDAVKSFPYQKRVDFLQERKLELEKALAEFVGYRRELLTTGVIYEKYRTLVAEASMLEYLESGRCDALMGENGAYNLYESAIHAGIVNPLLDQLLLSVETVKLSQTVLFKELLRISKVIKEGNNKLNRALGALKVKTPNTVLAEQWLAGKKAAEISSDEAAQMKLDAFTEYIKKQTAKDAEAYRKLEKAVPRA